MKKKEFKEFGLKQFKASCRNLEKREMFVMLNKDGSVVKLTSGMNSFGSSCQLVFHDGKRGNVIAYYAFEFGPDYSIFSYTDTKKGVKIYYHDKAGNLISVVSDKIKKNKKKLIKRQP